MRSSSFHYEERQPRDERHGHRDDGYGAHGHDSYRHQEHYGYERTEKEPHLSQQQQHQLSFPPPSYPYARPPRGLQAVVTSSFSLEDEREDISRRSLSHHRMAAPEMRERGHEMSREGVDEREGAYYNEYERSARANQPNNRHQVIHKSFSAGYRAQDGPLKRSYYHHSHAYEDQAMQSQLPADFMPPTVPPKRVKVAGSPRGEVIVTPRSPQGNWYSRGTWDAEQETYPRLAQRPARSFPPSQSWNHQRHSGSPSSSQMHGHGVHHINNNMPPIDESEPSTRDWHTASSSHWNGAPRLLTSHAPGYVYWESRHDDPMDHSPRESFDMQAPYYTSRSGSDDKMQLVMDAAAATGDHSISDSQNLMILALPQDRASLSETLCVVRENVEVFIATKADVDAPAPGRKHSVAVGQVGLRCIHCRHTTKCSDRVKRAVCYPSSIKRIYRTVIDMKLDHFSQCKFVPEALKSRLEQLKNVQTRSTGTTMQYFIRAAHALGMEDSQSGVRLIDGPKRSDAEINAALSAKLGKAASKSPSATQAINRTNSAGSGPSVTSKASESMMSTESFDSSGSSGSIVSLEKYYDGCVSLALEEDKSSLSPLRCFLRNQVCAFSATEEDIASRAPTTFSIAVGQVGIGCIHCVRCAPSQRSNRAVCFPFSTARIYQSVADIQRFHFTECKNLPADVKEKFLELQSASCKGSKGLATRLYWVTSARKLGLVDTSRGIRFGRDPMKPEAAKAFSLDILAQAAFSVTTANKQLVVPEDRDEIAEFLYVVMEQLQPCRFTEADRNKRRLKDVGCIGVECKHCAGQVDGRKFFWSSVSAVESNFVSVHTHMLECRMAPESLKQELARLKSLRKEQTVALRTGSQKAFFARVWQRLHDDDEANRNQEFSVSAELIAGPPSTTIFEENTREDYTLMDHVEALPGPSDEAENENIVSV